MSDVMHRINCLVAEIEGVYHRATVKTGLSDSAMRILYTILDNGESCLLSDIYHQSGMSRQTVNSAIRKLEEEEILYLEPYRGKLKRVLLTEKGRALSSRTAARVYAAEKRVFEDWTQEEIEEYIRLMEKYYRSLCKQIEEME